MNEIYRITHCTPNAIIRARIHYLYSFSPGMKTMIMMMMMMMMMEKITNEKITVNRNANKKALVVMYGIWSYAIPVVAKVVV